jgi:hypothetical protein
MATPPPKANDVGRRARCSAYAGLTPPVSQGQGSGGEERENEARNGGEIEGEMKGKALLDGKLKFHARGNPAEKERGPLSPVRHGPGPETRGLGRLRKSETGQLGGGRLCGRAGGVAVCQRCARRQSHTRIPTTNMLRQAKGAQKMAPVISSRASQARQDTCW